MGQGLRGNNTVSNQEQVSMYAKFKALDDSESTASSTNSTNFEALDALVEVKMSSVENTTAIKDHLKESPNIKTVRKPRDPEGFKHNLPVSYVPPPTIPEVFKMSTTSMPSKMISIPPPKIPDVFLNAPSSGLGPNFWLNSSAVSTKSIQAKSYIKSTLKSRSR